MAGIVSDDVISESDAFDDAWQLVRAVELAHFFDAAQTRVKTISFTIFCGSTPSGWTVRYRTVAKTLSIGFEVRRYFQIL